MGNKHYVYILECKDKTLYTGYTTNITERMEKHASGKGAKYTRGRGPFILRYQEQFTTKEAAMKREYHIKRLSKERKLKLIKEGMDVHADSNKLSRNG